MKQGEEDDTLDWTAVVTAHPEYLAEDMDLSTDNVSEMERTGTPGMTQDNDTSRKPSVFDESSADGNEQEENQSQSRRHADTDVQPKTETAKTRASRSKKIKLVPGSVRKTEREKVDIGQPSNRKKTKCETTGCASPLPLIHPPAEHPE